MKPSQAATLDERPRPGLAGARHIRLGGEIDGSCQSHSDPTRIIHMVQCDGLVDELHAGRGAGTNGFDAGGVCGDGGLARTALGARLGRAAARAGGDAFGRRGWPAELGALRGEADAIPRDARVRLGGSPPPRLNACKRFLKNEASWSHSPIRRRMFVVRPGSAWRTDVKVRGRGESKTQLAADRATGYACGVKGREPFAQSRDWLSATPTSATPRTRQKGADSATKRESHLVPRWRPG